jgi:isoleucyl-tRNA synthetase
MDDYEACLARGIEAFAPVNDEGRFTDKAMPQDPSRLIGKSVLGEGNEAVLQFAKECNQLPAQHKYEHKHTHTLAIQATDHHPGD